MYINSEFIHKDLFTTKQKNKSIREAFSDALITLAERIPNMVVLTADLSHSVKTDKFAQKYPKRFVNVGVAEQNMMGIAAGIAHSGGIPIVASYGVFNPGRNWEQLRLAMYSELNIKVIATHTGLSASADGATHQSLEDIALTRVLPNINVYSPCDYYEAYKTITEAIKNPKACYIRLPRVDSPIIINNDSPFNLNKAEILNEGSDITVISTGILTYEALKAAKELKVKHNIKTEIINVKSIKPLDIDTILKSVKKTQKLVTVEEHQVSAGLGSAVLENLLPHFSTLKKFTMIGLNNEFGQTGSYEELKHHYELDAQHIKIKIKDLLNSKNIKN
jgi:transketolase